MNKQDFDELTLAIAQVSNISDAEWRTTLDTIQTLIKLEVQLHKLSSSENHRQENKDLDALMIVNHHIAYYSSNEALEKSKGK